MKVGIIDYGSGNFTSVYNAVHSITDQIVVITTASHFDECTHIILPGVGTFPQAKEKLDTLDITEKLKEQVIKLKKPFLGICVGLQILADIGFEFKETQGLSLVKGEVKKFDFSKDDSLVLPHIGWNSVHSFEGNPLFEGVDPEESNFYFVHSYHLISKDPEATFTYTDYGYDFISAFQKNNVFGVQFHPEKSQHNGIKLLTNFLNYA